MDVTGTTAIITGGASGLGRATASALHDRDAAVFLLDLETSGGEETAAAIGERASFVPTDVTDVDAVLAAIDHAVERTGGVHVAVNCAGVAAAQRTVGRDGPHDLEVFRRVVEVNLVGTFNVVRLAAAQMAAQEPVDGEERGVIINTASIAAFDPQIGQAAYAASKGGVASLTLAVARDVARHGVRCVTIAPGTFDTPMLAGLPPEARDELAANIPHPARLGDPSEYAALALHLVENAYVNGEVIRLDGALRMPPR